MTVWILIVLLKNGSTESTRYYSDFECGITKQRILSEPRTDIVGVQCVESELVLHQ